jgi:hypothetical protein
VTWPPATQNFMTARIVGDQSWIIGFARARLRTMEDRRNHDLLSGQIDSIHHEIGKPWHEINNSMLPNNRSTTAFAAEGLSCEIQR